MSVETCSSKSSPVSRKTGSVAPVATSRSLAVGLPGFALLFSVLFLAAPGIRAAEPPSEEKSEVTATESPREVYRQLVPGLLARGTYRAEGSDELRVEIWDLLVGPGKVSEPTTLPGGAVLEVRSGAGTVTIDGEKSGLRLGATLSVPEGAEISFDNGDADRPLAVRAVLIARR